MKTQSKLQEFMNQEFPLKIRKEDLARIRAGANQQSASTNSEQSGPKPAPQGQQSE